MAMDQIYGEGVQEKGRVSPRRNKPLLALRPYASTNQKARIFHRFDFRVRGLGPMKTDKKFDSRRNPAPRTPLRAIEPRESPARL